MNHFEANGSQVVRFHNNVFYFPRGLPSLLSRHTTVRKAKSHYATLALSLRKARADDDTFRIWDEEKEG